MSLQSILIVPDTHVPFHDKRAWELMMKVGKDLKPSVVVVVGDFLDCYSVSSHSKDPSRVLRMPEEIAEGKAKLRDLVGLKPSRKIYIAGNHEDRLRRYLQDKAPELFGVVDIPGLLELPKDKWEYIPYQSAVKIGKVHFTHDVGNSGRYSTQKALDIFQGSVVVGHSHRLSYVVEGNAKGEMKVGAQFGWLGDSSKIDYLHQVKVKTNWALGFGIGYVEDKTGTVYLTPVPIVQYKCVVAGKLYAA